MLCTHFPTTLTNHG